jgi:hypothetical protein
MKTLNDVKNEVEKYASLIGATGYDLPTYRRSEDFARPHIEVDQLGYHYVVVERGQELSRQTTHDVDELLYWIFDSVTFKLACDYELSHRIAKQDFRRILFSKQIKLLHRLSPYWAQQEQRKHHSILLNYPYDDNLDKELNAKMRDAGY